MQKMQIQLCFWRIVLVCWPLAASMVWVLKCGVTGHLLDFNPVKTINKDLKQPKIWVNIHQPGASSFCLLINYLGDFLSKQCVIMGTCWWTPSKLSMHQLLRNFLQSLSSQWSECMGWGNTVNTSKMMLFKLDHLHKKDMWKTHHVGHSFHRRFKHFNLRKSSILLYTKSKTCCFDLPFLLHHIIHPIPSQNCISSTFHSC